MSLATLLRTTAATRWACRPLHRVVPLAAPQFLRRYSGKTAPNLYYTKTHEWIRVDGDIGTIGLSEYAQGELGEIVFVENTNVDTKVSQKDELGTVESTKAVTEVYSPVSGTIVEVNELLKEDPELINEDPLGDGWMCKIKMSNPEELKKLLREDETGE